mmetsp:Transcript_44936/g.90656  ORF Transcript_44936/g.90656 Transcript_44936/m.90656 type:complete len:180 (-) Transcript_44936:21-560(-)
MRNRDLQTVSIRPIRLPDDLPRVQEIFRAGVRFYSDTYDEKDRIRIFWERYIEEAVSTDLSDIESVYLRGGGFWVALDTASPAGPSQIIGIVGAERKSDAVVELRRMSVWAGARKKGLGSALIKVVEDFAVANGFREVVLSTGRVMAPAIQLYSSNGYEPKDNDFQVLFRKRLQARSQL